MVADLATYWKGKDHRHCEILAKEAVGVMIRLWRTPQYTNLSYTYVLYSHFVGDNTNIKNLSGGRNGENNSSVTHFEIALQHAIHCFYLVS